MSYELNHHATATRTPLACSSGDSISHLMLRKELSSYIKKQAEHSLKNM
jgi:hypothetical protein